MKGKSPLSNHGKVGGGRGPMSAPKHTKFGPLVSNKGKGGNVNLTPGHKTAASMKQFNTKMPFS
jgi:hypothetical protein